MDDDVIAQLVKLGAPDHVIDAARNKSQPVDVDFLVWEENWQAVTLFLALKTQWRMAVSMAGLHYFGIEYASAYALLDARQIAPGDREALMDALRLMEDAALPLLNKPNE
ncbi:MAG: DUF1799 domain-containing protein [Burkholderiaceae bacterium]|nr:DUF1799 domain-containing protein [Burkholderiaceae bacterium]